MKVRVLYFAKLRERLGVDEETVEVSAAAPTVAALLAALRARGGVWAEALAEESGVIKCAVNQRLAGGATALADGAEVAFFPPVTGG